MKSIIRHSTLILLSLFLFGFGEGYKPVGNDLKVEERTFEIVNKYREKKGLSELKIIPYMSELAREHSLKMAQGFRAFGHRGWDERADLIFDNIEVEMVAENVGFNKGYDKPEKQILEGWIKSKTHKQNILNEEFDICGVGVAEADDGTYYFTQIFASYWEE
ncbi:MAG: CAP domain-containing protein [Bacteroidia bacterium]